MTDFSDWSPHGSAAQPPPPPSSAPPPPSTPAPPAHPGGRFATVITHPPQPVAPRAPRRVRRWTWRSLGRPRPVPAWVAPFVAAAFVAGSGVAAGMITVNTGPGVAADPLAGRPHVTDEESGVSYGVPIDWDELPEDAGFHSLPPPFTSGISTPQDAEESAAVMVTSTTGGGDLQDIASEQLELLISLNMGADEADTTEAEPTWIDGRQAAVSTLTLDTPGFSGTSLRSVAFTGDGGRTVVVVSMLTEDAETQHEADIAAVMASIRVI